MPINIRSGSYIKRSNLNALAWQKFNSNCDPPCAVCFFEIEINKSKKKKASGTSIESEPSTNRWGGIRKKMRNVSIYPVLYCHTDDRERERASAYIYLERGSLSLSLQYICI